MATKIKNELEKRIKQLAESGYNGNRIATEVGLSEGAISGWAKKNGIVLQKRISPETLAKENRFIELLSSGNILKHICKELKLDHRAALKIAKKYNLVHLLRNRGEAAKDKRFTMEEVNDKLPVGHGRAIKFDFNTKSYIIQREDGSTYTRIHSQIFRGDPNLSQKRRSSENEIAEKLLSIGYRLIPGTYTRKHSNLQAEHIVCGHIRETGFYDFFNKSCARCSNTGTSREESTLAGYVQSLNMTTEKFKFNKDYKGKGKGKEIDIFIKELNLGIEYCGLYFHGERAILHDLEAKTKRYEEKGKAYAPTIFDNPKLKHKAKMDKSNDIGIQLITIFSNEWKDSNEKVKAILKAKLGKNEIKIFARKTEIKEIDDKTSRRFLDMYHLQGNTRSIVRFGLFYKEELIAVITGNHHHRIKGAFVLNRLCFKAGVTVVGGASKLNKSLENWAKSNGYSEITSWSDNRWSDGNVYRSLGYVLREELPPDYFYFDNKGNTYSKQSCQKKHLLVKGATGNTEWEMAKSLGYDRIFDCGKKAWKKKLT